MNRRTPRLQALALICVLLGLSLSATFARTTQPTLAPATTGPSFDHTLYLPLVQSYDSCTTNVYPITMHMQSLEDDPDRVPYPNAPEPMPDPLADIADIPSASRFQVARDPSSGGPNFYHWTRWNGDQSTSGANDLADALTGSGTLWAGFREKAPPPAGFTNGPRPGVLEAGDWVAVKTGVVVSLSEQLFYHIDNKTLMTLLIFDLQSGSNSSPDSTVRVARFAQARLVSYTVQGTITTLEFALVQDNYTCPAGSTPTATSTAVLTATNTAIPTATATGTAVPTATSTVPPGDGACVTNVYPITMHASIMDDDPTRVPYPNAPEPMPDPAAEIADIPSASRFQVVRNPSGGPTSYYWVRWNGDQSTSGANDLADALTGSGTLWAGFREKTPPPAGFTNGPRPGVLEAGDWVAVKTGITANVSDQLDYHIANKTLMTLLISDMQSGSYVNPDSSFRIARFAQARLVSYTQVGDRNVLEFALVQDYYTCP